MSATLPVMPCLEFVEQVTNYLEGALSEFDRARFEHHLSYCPPCQLYLEQMRTTLQLTGRLRWEDVPEPSRDELMDMFQRWRDDRT